MLRLGVLVSLLLAAPALARTDFVFTDPRGGPDGAIERALRDLVQGAVPGSRVRVAMYRWTRAGLARDLVAASARGVDVRVVVDDATVPCLGPFCAPGEPLRVLLAGLPAGSVTVCPSGACLGSGIQHNKFFLFSALGDGSTDVVAQSSANLTGAARRQWNNLVVVRDDPALHRAYSTYFDALRAGDAARPTWTALGSTGAVVRFFPRPTDPVASELAGVSCSGGARVRVAMAFFRDARLHLARGLARLRHDGCAVEAVLRGDRRHLGPRVRAALHAAGVRVRVQPDLHSKYVLLETPALGRLVLTGSHNWTGRSLSANDEALLSIPGDAAFEAFEADFERLWASGRGHPR